MKSILAIGYYHHGQTIIMTGENNMDDVGRIRICEHIAREFPFSVDTVYFTYEIVRKGITKKKLIVTLDEQTFKTKRILDTASIFGLSPIGLANFIFGDEEK